MPDSSPETAFLSELASRLDIARWGSHRVESLTAEVAHASALLLMLAARGDMERPAIRQLIGLMDGKTQVLREAMAYLEQASHDQAIESIQQGLDTEQLAFVLMQLYDVMTDIDTPPQEETVLFERLRSPYDGSNGLLSTSLTTLKYKNALSSLGPYEPPTSATASALSPTQVLAESLLRITVADGVVDPAQVEYMGLLLSRYEGLQSLTVKTARSRTSDQFFLNVRGLLSPSQALCILCQSAHLIFIEGKGTPVKWQFFRHLRDAWSVSERDMAIHLGTLKFNASHLVSRRDENAQPTAWGMKADNLSGASAARRKPEPEDDPDVVQYRQGAGNGSNLGRKSALHRGPITPTPPPSPNRNTAEAQPYHEEPQHAPSQPDASLPPATADEQDQESYASDTPQDHEQQAIPQTARAADPPARDAAPSPRGTELPKRAEPPVRPEPPKRAEPPERPEPPKRAEPPVRPEPPKRAEPPDRPESPLPQDSPTPDPQKNTAPVAPQPADLPPAAGGAAPGQPTGSESAPAAPQAAAPPTKLTATTC